MSDNFDVIVVGAGAAEAPIAAPCPAMPMRALLAQPFEEGEATHGFDFSTAHGAHDSGRQAAEEAFVAL